MSEIKDLLVELGDKYFSEKKFEEAFKHYSEASDLGSPVAQYNLATCYRYGFGIGKDMDKAVEYYQKAAALGHADAKKMLEGLVSPTKQDDNKPVLSADELFKLGWDYDNKKEYAKAVEYYRKAKELGNTRASKQLESLESVNPTDGNPNASTLSADEYLKLGEKCMSSKEETKGVECYRKAAEQGYDKAQYRLANCYFEGNGVSKDKKTAKMWYKKAADQGLAEAKEKLNGLWALFC